MDNALSHRANTHHYELLKAEPGLTSWPAASWTFWWCMVRTWRGLGLLASKLPRTGPHKATGQVFPSRTCSEGWGGAVVSLAWDSRCWWPPCSPPKTLSPRGPETCWCSNGNSASSAERGLPSCSSKPWQRCSACPREGAASSRARPCLPKDKPSPRELGAQLIRWPQQRMRQKARNKLTGCCFS